MGGKILRSTALEGWSEPVWSKNKWSAPGKGKPGLSASCINTTQANISMRAQRAARISQDVVWLTLVYHTLRRTSACYRLGKSFRCLWLYDALVARQVALNHTAHAVSRQTRLRNSMPESDLELTQWRSVDGFSTHAISGLCLDDATVLD